MEKVKNSLIQHGKENNRIYLMKLDKRDLPFIADALNSLAEVKGYTKIFAKVPAGKINKFLKNGYIREAAIPGFYNGKKGCIFLAKYFSNDRKKERNVKEITKITNISIRKSAEKRQKFIPGNYSIQKAAPKDVVEMSDFYNEIFDTYPFPIGNPNYLRETMKKHINYYVIRDKQKIIALSSAEIDQESQNAEMTDFATLPEYRGNNLASCLLTRMEEDMKAIDFRTTYTMARAMSYGMNITFSKNKYHFAGTLINNTNISGQIESMNVWYKKLL